VGDLPRHPPHSNYGTVAEWQTRGSQNPVSVTGVRVRISPVLLWGVAQSKSAGSSGQRPGFRNSSSPREYPVSPEPVIGEAEPLGALV
jgi:hypothetical protein